jgi:hypothetical protein
MVLLLKIQIFWDDNTVLLHEQILVSKDCNAFIFKVKKSTKNSCTSTYAYPFLLPAFYTLLKATPAAVVHAGAS